MKKTRKESFESREIRYRAERVETRFALERISPLIREQMKFQGKEVTSCKKD